ncbi:MAG TPA: glycosyltransferase family 4 protein [Chthoniobacteraceae bacterium]|jgi:glycosyltransferase involved in cell wall biosynthesis|nr:glycosyltransferase family 4 protein [Chthoniobacteraceae bacterium]
MHVCLLNMQIEYYSPVSGGAIAAVTMEYARNLEAMGHRVTVLTALNGDEPYREGEVVPLAVRTRDSLSFIERRISDLRRKMNSWDYPYYEYYMRSFKGALARLSPAPDVVLLHNDLVSARYIKQALPRTKVALMLHNETRTVQRDKKKALAAVDAFLPLGDYIRNWTASAHPVPTAKLAPIRNGVDIDTFKPRAAYLDAASPVRVLFVGRIDPNKGPDIAADAVAQLRKEGLPVTLTVAGGLWFYGHGREMEDPYFRLLKIKMDVAGADYRGHVNRNRIPELMRGHDIVCILSRSQEPYALVTLEAMASGCAVIASKRGGLPEASGGAAILVEPEDFESVAAALRSLVSDPELLRAQKLKSIRRAATQTWKAKTEILEGIFRQLCGAGSESAPGQRRVEEPEEAFH